MVPRGTDDNSVVVGPHIRGSRLRASAAGDEEVDLLLPGTARYDFVEHLKHVVVTANGSFIFGQVTNMSYANLSLLFGQYCRGTHISYIKRTLEEN